MDFKDFSSVDAKGSLLQPSKSCALKVNPENKFTWPKDEPYASALRNAKLTTADDLYQACDANKIPENHHTLDEFGFSNTIHDTKRTRLLAVYKAVKDMGTACEELHRWQMEPSPFALANHVDKVLYKSFEEAPGDLYPWFKRNRSLIEGDKYYPRSVWGLVSSLDKIENPHVPFLAELDYGFRNCKDDRSRVLLKQFYNLLLTRTSPYLLHDACVRGNIYEFAIQNLGKVDSRFKRLVENEFPESLAEDDSEYEK